MLHVPTSIWNEIAHFQTLQTAWARVMFPLPNKLLERVHDVQAERMVAHGYDNKVILAYQTMLANWLERQAITDYICFAEALELRDALPDLVSLSATAGWTRIGGTGNRGTKLW